MSTSEPILSEFLTKKNSPPNCGSTRERSIVGMCLALAHRGRSSDVRCFIVERPCRNGSSRKSNRPWDVRYDGCRPEARNAPNLAFARVVLTATTWPPSCGGSS